jgi:hypothetical protein|tara:strand:- start:306 stop:1490 length:1185 start_codon:yes stop_codon:yes gene_type:complete
MPITEENNMSTPFTAHADIVNAQYEHTESHFVSLQQRIDEAFLLAPKFQAQLEAVVEEFKRRNKDKWKEFADISLVQAIPVNFSNIKVDSTMQRPVNMRHVLSILNHFSQTMVMPIQVYEVNAGPSTEPTSYIAWDGQHTAIALYIILTKVFGERQAQAMVPVNIYPIKHRLEIRRNFILLNGDAKEKLDFIDTYKQMVYGVKVDLSDDEIWQDTAKINDILKEAGLFVTHDKFGDERKAGAFTLLADTIMTKNLAKRKDVDVTRMFAKYWTYINEERPVQAKEARVLYEFFDACFKDGIKVDDKYLLNFALFCKEYFEANWSETGSFWSKVKLSYETWYAQANADEYAENGLKGFTTEPRFGIPFLIAQMKKSTTLKTPKYKHLYAVDGKDLW